MESSPTSSSGMKTLLHINPDMDYAVVRLEIVARERVGLRADISYESQSGEWVPSKVERICSQSEGWGVRSVYCELGQSSF